MAIGDDIRTAGAALIAIDSATDPEDIVKQLNPYLNTFSPQRFRAMTAHAIKDEATTPEFLSVLVATARSNGVPGPQIPSEAMASVIDVHRVLDLASFRESYERIAQAKAIPKAEPAPEGE